MHYVELVAALSILQFLFFGAMTGKARVKYGVKAPAVSGAEGFERAYRVQMNTLELLVAFIPTLFIAGHYFPSLFIAAIGLVYIVGRFMYYKAYVSEPKSRGLGFMISFIPVVALVVLAVLGPLLRVFGVGF